MSIRNAGNVIKEARLRAGMTQEQLSDGICSLVSLCNIETGKKGVSPSTFQALMQKTGTYTETYPLFKNCKDFDAYMLLKNARLYADKYCFSLAYEELMKLKLCSYCCNRLYYQESLFLLARVKYISGDSDFNNLLSILNKAINLSLPDFNVFNFGRDYLSSVEYEILILIANIFIDAQKIDSASTLSQSLNQCISNNIIDDKYTAYLKMLCLFTDARLLFIAKRHEKAKEQLTLATSLSEKYYIETYRLEIKLLSHINNFCLDSTSLNKDFLYLLSLASHLDCGYVNKLKHVSKKLGIPVEYRDVRDSNIISFHDFPFTISEDTLNDGNCDLLDNDTLTIGVLISKLRKEQRLSLNSLSEGLCSVSKLSKIEHDTQYPGIYLTEALLNRLGYSERDFTFYGNLSESEYYKSKSFLLSKYRLGQIESQECKNKLEKGLKSNNPAIKQLCLLLKNNTDCFSADECEALIEAIKITIPDINLNNFSEKRFSWTELSILNSICVKMIKLKKFDIAEKINSALLAYSRNYFITPGYKSISLFPSYRLRFRYLYNMKLYKQIIYELNELNDEFLIKSPETASDFFFYSSQAHGELKNYDKMAEQAEIAAGYFILIGQSRRKNYLISEIQNQFGVSI